MGVCANVAATSGRRSVQFCTTLHILKCGGQIRQYNFAQFILIARASPDHHLLELCKGDLTGSVEVGLPEKYFQTFANLRSLSPENVLDHSVALSDIKTFVSGLVRPSYCIHHHPEIL